jgi:hypothetical protein
MIEVRPQTPADVTGWVHTYNAYYPYMASSKDEMLREDEMFGSLYNTRRYVVQQSGEPVGYGSVLNMVWVSEPGRKRLSYAMVESASGGTAEDALVDHLIQEASSDSDATRLNVVADGFHSGRLQRLAARGFRTHLMLPVVFATQDRLDPALCEEAPADIEVSALSELKDGADRWIERFYHLTNEVLSDVPMGDSYQPEPLDVFAQYVTDPVLFDPADVVIARDGEDWVGMTELYVNRVNRNYANTGLTGVIRSHRRRGIARCMKLRSMRSKFAEGVQTIISDNEENNPMLQLNFRLGFRTEFERHLMKLDLA